MAQASPWIAVVDDDPAVRKALKRLLGTRGFQARTYASAREFLAALPDGVPGCLVVDLHMPEIGGLDLQQRLNGIGLRVPTIVITAHDDDDIRERCEAAGAIGFLSKPLQDTRLFAALDMALGTVRSHP